MIRDAVPADLSALCDVFRRSSLSNAGDRANLLAHPEVLELSDVAVRQSRTRVAIDTDGRVVGFATALPVGDIVEVEDLFVDPEWMRRGIGRALMADLTARAVRHGVGRVEVTANPHAMAFYGQMGFVFDRDVETRFGPAARLRLAIDGPMSFAPE